MKADVKQFKLRDDKKAKQIIHELKKKEQDLTLMHVCGTHQDTLVRHGLEPVLEDAGVDIRQGPGCPVCVTTPREIEEIIQLSKEGVTITAFGDMVKVPGTDDSLAKARARGADVRIVYSVDDAVQIAQKTDDEVVFMAVGFETTSPSIASAVINDPPDNFSILTCHRVVPPALEAILNMGEIKLDGLIEPGHVSVIIGTEPYEPISQKHNIPQVVAGFEPLDLLMSVYMIAKQVEEGRSEVENEYGRAVKPEGNPKALELLDEVFDPKDIEWRGFPEIPDSGYELKTPYEHLDARKRFEDELLPIKNKVFEEPEGCRCGEVLRGIIDSERCPLFGTKCTPSTPVGPCMVSREGSCNIDYRYQNKR